MTVHIAILKKHYINLIIHGKKNIECRLTKVKCAPFGKIANGDTIYLKQSSGPIAAKATVKKFITFENLAHRDIINLKNQYNDMIMGQSEYWLSKHNSKYCVLIWLENIQPLQPFKINNRGMQAWIICNQQQKTELLTQTKSLQLV